MLGRFTRFWTARTLCVSPRVHLPEFGTLAPEQSLSSCRAVIPLESAVPDMSRTSLTPEHNVWVQSGGKDVNFCAVPNIAAAATPRNIRLLSSQAVKKSISAEPEIWAAIAKVAKCDVHH